MFTNCWLKRGLVPPPKKTNTHRQKKIKIKAAGKLKKIAPLQSGNGSMLLFGGHPNLRDYGFKGSSYEIVFGISIGYVVQLFVLLFFILINYIAPSSL